MAQRANGRPISFPGLDPDGVEVAGDRWRHGIRLRLPDGRHQYIVSGPMHFRVEDAWHEIDNRWLPAEAPWDYEMLAADYQARLLQRLDAGQMLRLEKGGHHLTFQPAALNWTNDLDMIEQISMPEAVDGVVSNFGETSLCQQGRIGWVDGYGSGLNFAYIPSTHFFRKLLTIGSLDALGTPAQYIIDGGNPVLSLSFIFTSDLDLYVDGELWDRQSRRQTAERIEFRDGETVHWWWGVPNATDANGDIQPGTIELRKTGPNLHVSVHIPWEWLQVAVYPVTIDPDTYYSETTDGQISGEHAVYATAHATATNHNAGGANFFLGQATGFYVLRGLGEFDTSGMAGAASQGNLYLTCVADVTAIDINVEIMKCAWTSPLDAGNRDANFDAAVAAVKDVTWRNTSGMSVNTSYGSPNLDTTWIDPDGTTQYAFVSDEDIAVSEPAGDEYLYIATREHATQGYRPYLSIIEAAAGGNPWHAYAQQ